MGMNRSTEPFDIEREGETLIVTPVSNLGELEFQLIETGAGPVLDQLAASSARNLVLDFRRTDYFGTTALGFFVKLWKKIRGLGGHMSMCNLSEHEKEILHLTRLDTLWAICDSRREAVQAVRG
jgi:anti-anti-sigma factor